MMTTRIFTLRRTNNPVQSRMTFTIRYKPNGDIDSGNVVQMIRYATHGKWRKHHFYWPFDKNEEFSETHLVLEENEYDAEFLRRLWISMREAGYEVETEQEELADVA